MGGLPVMNECGTKNCMNAVTLKAHYDGKQICLDEPYELPINARLLVTVVEGGSEEDERAAWLAVSQAWLANAYGEDEPDHSNAILREEPPKS